MAVCLFCFKMFCAVICFVLATAGSVDSYNLNRSDTDLDKLIRDTYGPPVFSEPRHEAPQTEVSDSMETPKHESDVDKSIKDIFRPPLASEQTGYIPQEAVNRNQTNSRTETEDVFIDPKVLEDLFSTNPNPSMLKTDVDSSNNREKDKTTPINNAGLDLEVIWPGASSHNYKYDTPVNFGGSDDQSRSNPDMQHMTPSTSEPSVPPQSIAGPDDNNSTTNDTILEFETDKRFLSESLLTQAFGNSLQGVQKRNAIIDRNTKELVLTEPGLRQASTEHEHRIVVPTSHTGHKPLSNHSSSNYVSSTVLILFVLCIFPWK